MSNSRIFRLFFMALAILPAGWRLFSYGRFANEVRVASYRMAGATIGLRVTIRPGVILKGCRNIVIGDDVFIGEGSSIVAYGGSVTIGDKALIADHVYISTRNHRFRQRDVPIIEQGYKSGSVSIGCDVWLAHGVVVLAGASIARGTVVSAGVVAPSHTTDYQIIFRDGTGERT